MKTYSTDQLKEIRKLHQLWLQSKEGGVRADLSNAYLGGANFSGANFSGAYLSGAYLGCANFGGANFSGAIGQPPTDDELLKIRDGACPPGADRGWVALSPQVRAMLEQLKVLSSTTSPINPEFPPLRTIRGDLL